MRPLLRSLLHLWRLSTLPRGLLQAHLRGYGELAAAELAQELQTWRQHALLQAGSLLGASLALVLGGLALMLWAVTPAAQIHAPWLLWTVPLAPALLALGCQLMLRSRPSVALPFPGLRRQLRADLAFVQGEAAVVQTRPR